MRERIRLFLAVCFYYSGLVRLALWWKQRNGPYLTIMNYHEALFYHQALYGLEAIYDRKTSRGQLYDQMRFFRRHYRVLPLEEALDEFFSGRRNPHDKRPLLALTFDDGYLDNYVEAFRCARELQVPIAIFLVPGSIESGVCFWWFAADYLADTTSVEKVIVDEQTYLLAEPGVRKELARAIDTHLRQASSIAERERFLSEIQQALEVQLPRRVEGKPWDDLLLPVTWEQVHEMEESGWVSFGAHTLNHPILSRLTDSEELRREVSECRVTLEQRLGHPVYAFVYPVGKMEHIGEQCREAIKSAGYKWAFTTVEGVNNSQADTLLLQRLPGDVATHWLIMASDLVGLLGIVSRLRKKR